jgi:hypothetical protein
MYKKAAKARLRFQTSVGALSTEQLFGLSLKDLDNLAVSLQEEYKKSGKKSFLETKSEKDKLVKLRFDIVLDVLNTLVDNSNKAAKSAETRAFNQKIDTLIAAKEDKDLGEKSIEELMALRKA